MVRFPWSLGLQFAEKKTLDLAKLILFPIIEAETVEDSIKV